MRRRAVRRRRELPVGRLVGEAERVITYQPCAQVSMNRAVSFDVTLIAGPYQGIRAFGSALRNASSIEARADRNHVSSAVPSRVDGRR